MSNFFCSLENLQFFKNENYINILRLVASLSRLFSDNKSPFLHYRIMENSFCRFCNAENLSRSDLAYDAKIVNKNGNIGVGLKTFLCDKYNYSVEKIAEFNKKSTILKTIEDKYLLTENLAKCRNDRIDFANRNYDIQKAIYHIVARKENKLIFFNTDYDKIDLDSLKILSYSEKSLIFKDNQNEYNFNFSKSVLQRKFFIPKDSFELNIDIISDPINLLLSIQNEILSRSNSFTILTKKPGIDYVILPLYSVKDNNVPERSQLNQWNASGRPRDKNEIYISIPIIIHKVFPNFFPRRDIPFYLKTPSDEILFVKVCQDNGKALMSNPNKELGNWLLRKVLKLREGELLTMERLEILGIDSVIICKDKNNYSIDFMPINSYKNFEKNFCN